MEYIIFVIIFLLILLLIAFYSGMEIWGVMNGEKKLIIKGFFRRGILNGILAICLAIFGIWQQKSLDIIWTIIIMALFDIILARRWDRQDM